MAKPRRVSAMSTVLKETQEYNKVTQEDEQVISTPVEQETATTEKQITVDTEKHVAVNTDIQKSVDTGVQKSTTTTIQKSASAEMQKAVNAEANERTHKQTILISEDLAFRLKVHAAKRKETIASITTRALEKLLAEEN